METMREKGGKRNHRFLRIIWGSLSNGKILCQHFGIWLGNFKCISRIWHSDELFIYNH